MKSFFALPALLLLASNSALALVTGPGGLPLPVPPPVIDEDFHLKAAKRTPTYGNATFQQLIDHNEPALGTFTQHYWWSTQFWTGPGAPVIFFNPGEVPAATYTGYLTNRTITGMFAEAVGGAVVMVEHRYWGDSSPYDTLTTETLAYLTLENSIKDNVHFAETVELPFDPSGQSNAQHAPWVMAGGSYSGALAGWTAALAPGTYWAYFATSAVVQVIEDFVRLP